MKNIKTIRGFTLIEILILPVVGFIALAGVVAYITYPKVQAANRANDEAGFINLISASIKDLYSSSPNFIGLNNAVLLNARKIPDSRFNINDAAINNSFGGTITMAPTNLGTGINNAYTITTNLVPQLECVKLATGVGNNFNQVAVGETVVKTFGTAQQQVDVIAATTACAAGGNTNALFFSSGFSQYLTHHQDFLR